MVLLRHLKPILKWQTGMVNPRKGILVPFNHCFYKWLAYLFCPACARGAWFTQTCLGKIDKLMLTKEVHWSTLIGTSTFQYRCNRKFENPIYMSVPRARAARGAWYFWIGWSDCLNHGTKRFVSMRPTYIAQTTLPNCLLTTKNRQKQ